MEEFCEGPMYHEELGGQVPAVTKNFSDRLNFGNLSELF